MHKPSSQEIRALNTEPSRLAATPPRRTTRPEIIPDFSSLNGRYSRSRGEATHKFADNSSIAHDRFCPSWISSGSVNQRFDLNPNCTEFDSYPHLHTDLVLKGNSPACFLDANYPFSPRVNICSALAD
ncbi:hypothetical protein T265_10419 [Opisthorchis viverrini]|uniref:Uncharacterized protein n=1 Tax=Opisthorchis viverrini TaxID=6198 RepID=A0A074Z2E0_OPIVI|nr:hypothetical protein T265_10419 [Opisthorchis viverrini]KER21211.1 hypothetical protein T265_10419 [Opisthorchis viverrini]